MKYKFTSKFEGIPLHISVPINRLDGHIADLPFGESVVLEIPDDQDLYAGHGNLKLLEKKGRLLIEKVEEKVDEEPKEEKKPEVKAKEEPKEEKKDEKPVFAFGDKGKDKDDHKKKDKK